MDNFAKKMFGKKYDRHKIFVMEPMDCNVNTCVNCMIDCFYYWIRQSNSDTFMCINCADKNYKHIVDNFKSYEFYYKYKDEDLDQFFKRIECKLRDPEYIDTGLQIPLLMKAEEWPAVRTKANLKEDGIPYIRYPKDPNKPK